jgi:hypothetical protein
MILCPNFVRRLVAKLSVILSLQAVFTPGLKAESNWVGEHG